MIHPRGTQIRAGWKPSHRHYQYSRNRSSFMWYLRLLPNVSQAFGAIWGVDSDEDLLCSFDGDNVFSPWRYKSDWKIGRQEVHGST
mmetsp:Transcript_9186/g.11570  ORF Transcript_9186/g.11570 Transcript_9186/m.11570 type:complete len:86 (+) Transcript_9186:144-401(+)